MLIGQIEQQVRQNDISTLEENVSIIRKTLEQSIHLIHDYLEREYLESSQTAIKQQQVELIEQLETLLNGYKRMDMAGQKHFRLESSSPKVFAQVDLTKFLQVFANLISDANKFTHENGHITIRM